MPTVRIRDGVRRAKTVELFDRDRILAKMYRGDKWIETQEIPLVDLLSPQGYLGSIDPVSPINSGVRNA